MKKNVKNLKKVKFEVLTNADLVKMKGGNAVGPPPNPTGPDGALD